MMNSGRGDVILGESFPGNDGIVRMELGFISGTGPRLGIQPVVLFG
jgi:hypothetical protein